LAFFQDKTGTIAEITERTKTLGFNVLVAICQAVSNIGLWDSTWAAEVHIGPSTSNRIFFATLDSFASL
jgi:hypothetical protein